MFWRPAILWRGLAVGLRRLWGRAFGGARAAERRHWQRFPSGARTTCQPAVEAEAQALRARVQNISCGGINLLVSRRLEPGLLLHVDVPEVSPEKCRLLACVIQVTAPLQNAWSLGCSFIRELTEKELRTFL
jgi:hypothetical protein